MPFTSGMVAHLRYRYNLTDRFTRLRAAGKLTAEEVAERFSISVCFCKTVAVSRAAAGAPLQR
jgi:hypothetical protein